MKEMYNKRDRQLHSLPHYIIPYAPCPPFPPYRPYQNNNLSYYPTCPQYLSISLDQNELCPSIRLPEEEIIIIIKTRYHNIIDAEEFITDCKVNDCIKLLKNHYNRKDFITLNHRTYLYICPNCEGWRVITKKQREVLCIKCTNSKRNEYKRKQRDESRKVDPSSSIRHDYLTHNQLCKKLKTVNATNRRLTKAINKI